MVKFLSLIIGLVVLCYGLTITGSAVNRGNRQELPQNIRLDTATVYVAADSTRWTRPFYFANRYHRTGKIAIIDTNILDQDTINIGDVDSTTAGVKIYQYLCFVTGNMFGFDTTDYDTACDLCGDSINFPFVNHTGLSVDSIILAKIDTSKMTQYSFGGDSMWISNGYFIPIIDPAVMVRYKIVGNSGFGATAKKVIMMIWTFGGEPSWTDK